MTSPAILETDLLQEAPSPIVSSQEAESIVEQAEQMLREAAPHECDVLVLGAGEAGCAAAFRAAQLGAKTIVIEENEIGGRIESSELARRALLETSEVLRLAKRADEYGVLLRGGINFDFAAAHARKNEIVRARRTQLKSQLQTNNVKVLRGRGRFLDLHTVEITDANGATQTLRAVHVIIATGARPQNSVWKDAITFESALQSNFLPSRLFIVGGDAPSIEIAQIFATASVQTMLLIDSENLLPQFDEAIGVAMRNALEKIDVEIVVDRRNEMEVISGEAVLAPAEWDADIADLGLDDIGVERRDDAILVDEKFQTNVGGVYAVGACTLDYYGEEAPECRGAVADIALGRATHPNFRFAPICCRAFMGAASVGLTERAAHERGYAARVGQADFVNGFVKLIADEETRALLGCHIFGTGAAELINEAALALSKKLSVESLSGSELSAASAKLL